MIQKGLGANIHLEYVFMSFRSQWSMACTSIERENSSTHMNFIFGLEIYRRQWAMSWRIYFYTWIDRMERFGRLQLWFRYTIVCFKCVCCKVFNFILPPIQTCWPTISNLLLVAIPAVPLWTRRKDESVCVPWTNSRLETNTVNVYFIVYYR